MSAFVRLAAGKSGLPSTCRTPPRQAAGADFARLDAPCVIQARDNRAVVFDSGNQRLVKLLFSEAR